MSDPIILNDEQLSALDQVIDALKSGELTEDELRESMRESIVKLIPVNPPVHGAARNAVAFVGTGMVGLAIILTGTVLAPIKGEKLVGDADTSIPSESTLDQLLEIRRRATDPGKKDS